MNILKILLVASLGFFMIGCSKEEKQSGDSVPQTASETVTPPKNDVKKSNTAESSAVKSSSDVEKIDMKSKDEKE